MIQYLKKIRLLCGSEMLLCIDDLLSVFGYKSKGSVIESIKAGNFPKPDVFEGQSNSSFKIALNPFGTTKFQWYVKTIRNEIARRRELETKPQCRVREVKYK